MIAVDTNILVYAHRPDAPLHRPARIAMETLIGSEWAIAWPSVHEFISTVTNPRLYSNPTPLERAFNQIGELRGANARLLHESGRHLRTLEEISVRGGITGGRIHDARIAAICLDHGITELWTADRDFERFPALATRNPLV